MPCNRVSSCVSVSLASCLSHLFSSIQYFPLSLLLLLLISNSLPLFSSPLFIQSHHIAGVLRDCVNQKRFSLSFFLFSFTHLVGVVFFFFFGLFSNFTLFCWLVLFIAYYVHVHLQHISHAYTHVTNASKKKRSKYIKHTCERAKRLFIPRPCLMLDISTGHSHTSRHVCIMKHTINK